ncbi:MAG: hypothetical protein ABR936_13400 [Bacteroidota bacterium]|jgi:hypothetical protein
MNYWYRLFLGLSIFVLQISLAIAQDAEYEKWLNQEEGKLQQFKEERDKEFSEFLKREWKEAQASQSEVPQPQPEPSSLPHYEGKARELPQSDVKPSLVAPAIPVVAQKENAPIQQPVSNYQHTAILNYYSIPIYFGYQEIPLSDADSKTSQEHIVKTWASLNNWNYTDLLKQALTESKKRSLNDWGYTLLLYEMGKKFFQDSKNDATLFTWFMLSKSGFNVKVAYNDNDIALLIPTRNMLYNTIYFTIKGDSVKYFAPSLEHKKVSGEGFLTYKGEYAGANKLISFDVVTIPNLVQKNSTKELLFGYDTSKYIIKTEFSNDAVSFFEYYPQVNYEVYFNAPCSQAMSQSLLPQLAEIIQGKSETEAINILLRFAQTAFQYKVDAEQFGREKPFFPDEILYYPYSNCKDRAIVFASLVVHLLGYEVIGLQYPDHVATAVKFQGQIKGDAVMHQGKKFVICDPTYINADIGMCMPQFKNVQPKVIALHN